MRRYASTYLRTRDGSLRMNIPEQIYHLGGYGRSKRLTMSIAKLTKNDQILLDKCDRFSLHLAPFPSKDLEQVFFVTVAIQSRPNTLASVLDFFKVNRIDILECRSVDRRLPEGGLVELIISVQDQAILDGEDHSKHPHILKEKLLNHLGYVRKDPLLGDALIDLALSVWGRIASLDRNQIEVLERDFSGYSGELADPQKEAIILQGIASLIPTAPLPRAFHSDDSGEIQDVRQTIREAFRRLPADLRANLNTAGEIPRWEREGEGERGGPGAEASSRVLHGKDDGIWNSIHIAKPLSLESIKQLTGNRIKGEYFHIEVEADRLIEPLGQHPAQFVLKLDQSFVEKDIMAELRGSPHNNYVSLIFDDRANVLQAVFKDPSEIIVCFIAILKNVPGQLEKIVSPLGKLSVDLRLINPLSPAQISEEWRFALQEDHLPYEIIANIENTKLKMFDKNSMLAIVQSEIFRIVGSNKGVPFIRISEIPMNEDRMNGIALTVLNCSILERKSLHNEVSSDKGGVEADSSWVLFPLGGRTSNSFDIHFLSSALPESTTVLLHLQITIPEAASQSGNHLGHNNILELLRLIFERQLVELRDKTQEEIPERLRSEFLAEASDAIHGISLIASCDSLCRMVIPICETSNLSAMKSRIQNNLGSLSQVFRDVKYGFLPFLERREWIYVAEVLRGSVTFRVEDNFLGCKEHVYLLQKGLEELVRDVSGDRMPDTATRDLLKNAVAEIQRILHPAEEVNMGDVIVRVNEVRERTQSK